MSPEEIIKKKKVDIRLLNECIERCVAGGVNPNDAYLSYNAFVKKEKLRLTKDEFLVLKGYNK